MYIVASQIGGVVLIFSFPHPFMGKPSQNASFELNKGILA